MDSRDTLYVRRKGTMATTLHHVTFERWRGADGCYCEIAPALWPTVKGGWQDVQRRCYSLLYYKPAGSSSFSFPYQQELSRLGSTSARLLWYQRSTNARSLNRSYLFGLCEEALVLGNY